MHPSPEAGARGQGRRRDDDRPQIADAAPPDAPRQEEVTGRARRARPRARLEVRLAGDRRLAEDIVLEVRALAARFGLAIADVTITKPRRRTAAKRAKRRT